MSRAARRIDNDPSTLSSDTASVSVINPMTLNTARDAAIPSVAVLHFLI